MQEPKFTVRFADGDADVISIFRFLVFISKSAQLAPVDAHDAVTEVNRVVYGASTGESFAVIAEIDGEIVGTLGVIKVPWWYNRNVFFLTDRWFFAFPVLHHKGIGAALTAEAAAIAAQLDLKLVINGRPKSRNGGSVFFEMPTVILPDQTSHSKH